MPDPDALKILLIGYSRIACKRIISALAASGRLTRLDIASQHSAQRAASERVLPGSVYDSYEQALAESPADIVYISLVNSEHAHWAEKALMSGRHVIVDKPSVTDYADALHLVELARSHNRALFEATVFQHHPQIDAIYEEFTSRNLMPTRVSAIFSFPPLPAGDFRYSRTMGGGALHDLGPYAISAGTVFFKEHPHTVFCNINSFEPDGVDTSFSITAVYSQGRAMVGHFGFTTEYQNTITVLGPELCVHCDRAFTIPTDYANTIDIRNNNTAFTRLIPPGDCFLNFFNLVFDACSSGDYSVWYEHFLKDAGSLNMLKQSVRKEIKL